MREIKFRQKLKKEYTKYAGEFHYWGFIDDCFHSPTGKNAACGESEQYTGLKDKNGVDIYEGDIVIYEGGTYGVDFVDGGFYIPTMNDCVYWDECCVVGNIYENPELLDGEL